MKEKDDKEAKENNVAASHSTRPISPSRKKASSASKIAELTKEIEKLTIELNDIKDKYLRTVAEFDNYKKRRSKEIIAIIERANEQICLEILPAIDDFERSLNSAAKRKSYKSLKQGIELVYQKLLAVLKKQGVEPIVSIGQQFNPELHEAIMQFENKEKAANVVIGEAVKGYRFKDKILRYSQVIVNK